MKAAASTISGTATTSGSSHRRHTTSITTQTRTVTGILIIVSESCEPIADRVFRVPVRLLANHSATARSVRVTAESRNARVSSRPTPIPSAVSTRYTPTRRPPSSRRSGQARHSVRDDGRTAAVPTGVWSAAVGPIGSTVMSPPGRYRYPDREPMNLQAPSIRRRAPSCRGTSRRVPLTCSTEGVAPPHRVGLASRRQLVTAPVGVDFHRCWRRSIRTVKPGGRSTNGHAGLAV